MYLDNSLRTLGWVGSLLNGSFWSRLFCGCVHKLKKLPKAQDVQPSLLLVSVQGRHKHKEAPAQPAPGPGSRQTRSTRMLQLSLPLVRVQGGHLRNIVVALQSCWQGQCLLTPFVFQLHRQLPWSILRNRTP